MATGIELRCPQCRKRLEPGAENASAPFCSARCVALDLSRWFDGSHAIPGRPEEIEDEGSTLAELPRDRD